jgi:adenylate kinase family enzyme
LKNVAIPPPRLIILGPSGSGISSLSQKLGAKWNVPVIDFFTYLQEFKKIASKEIKEEITSVLQGIGILQADTIKKIFHRLFSSEVSKF